MKLKAEWLQGVCVVVVGGAHLLCVFAFVTRNTGKLQIGGGPGALRCWVRAGPERAFVRSLWKQQSDTRFPALFRRRPRICSSEKPKQTGWAAGLGTRAPS